MLIGKRKGRRMRVVELDATYLITIVQKYSFTLSYTAIVVVGRHGIIVLVVSSNQSINPIQSILQ